MLGEGGIDVPERAEALLKFESVQRWLSYVAAERFGERASTNHTYLRFLEEFCSFAGKSPDELIAERQRQLKSTDEMEQRKHEETAMSFINFLVQERRLAPGSAKLALAAVRSFYKHNYSALVLKSPRLGWKIRAKRPPTREELRNMVKVASKPLHRAIILFLSQTGMSISDALQVTYGQVAEQFKAGASPVHLSVLRQKTKVRYDAFFGKEASEALKEYLATRNPDGSDRLFPLCDRAVNRVLERTSLKVGLSPPLSAHCLRKFFVTQLKMAGCNESLVEYWVGHQLAGSKEAYFIPSVESQREVYRKYEASLSIGSEEKPSADEIREIVSRFGGREQLLKLISEAE
jgi:integrase